MKAELPPRGNFRPPSSRFQGTFFRPLRPSILDFIDFDLRPGLAKTFVQVYLDSSPLPQLVDIRM